MRTKALGSACVVAGAMLLTLMQPSASWAQDTLTASPGSVLTGAIDVGTRAYTSGVTAQQRGKLEEYRDLRSGLLLEQFLLNYAPGDGFNGFQIVGRNLFERDQSLWLRLNRPGTYDLQVRWDKIPHLFSTDARSLGSFENSGVYTLPTPRPDSNAWKAAPFIAPVRTQWDPVKFSLGVTPSRDWDFRAEYTRIGKTGNRPIGMAFGSPGNNTREILEPIDQTAQDIRVTQSYAHKLFQAAASYDFSFFDNSLRSVTSDNPQQITDTPAAGSARALLALPPSNSAHTGVVTAAVNIPLRTRVVATGSYSRWKQDEPFLAQTINTALAADPRLALSRASLDGRASTALLSASLNSRPWKDLTISARARTYQYRNQTAQLALVNMAISDRSIGAGETSAVAPFTKHNADMTATYRLAQTLSVSAGYAYEQWTRDPDERNVAKTHERTPRVSVDFTGLAWLSLRAAYSNGKRRVDDYHQLGSAENPESRRFDEADRDRERTSLTAQITPIEQVSLTVTREIGDDAYPTSVFGLQSDKSALFAAEAEWSPSGRFSIGGGYSNEKFDDIMRQRYRTGTGILLANPTYDWVDHNTDRVTTMFANFRVILVPNKVEAGGNLTISDAKFRLTAMNPLTPSGGTAAQNLAATAVDFPEVSQKLHPMTLYLRYQYSSTWGLTARYQIETYEQNDFRTQNLAPSVGNHIFLANNYQNYDAGWLTLLISYRPRAMAFGKGRSTL
jgi:MtrB/PioB family decaheme-associated outer membrane protein